MITIQGELLGLYRLTIGAMVAFACGGAIAANSAGPTDSWVHGMPLQVAQQLSPRMIAINDQYVHKVADAREHDAENALVNDSTVALDMSAAQRYVTEILPAAPGKSYYLVRGCYYNENTGRYSVSSVGEVLVVSHVNLGTSTSPPKKRALLVALEGPAAQVYVGCATAR